MLRTRRPRANTTARDRAAPVRPRFALTRIDPSQRQVGDWLAGAARRHMMHALLEVDVTDARHRIRERRASSREPLSFTAYVVASLARAIDGDRLLHAHRRGRRDLVLFDDVDVAVVVERDIDGARTPVPSVVRAANRKSAARISREILAAGRGRPAYARARRLLPLWLLVPAPVRRFVLGRLLADPWRRRRLTGTTFVSAVGMFGQGTAWGLPQAQAYTLGLTVGSLARKPGIVRIGGAERIEPREFLALTLSIDHDVVAGAPAARFTNRFKELLEGGAVLDEPAGDAIDAEGAIDAPSPR